MCCFFSTSSIFSKKKKKADRHGLYSPSLSIRDRQLLVVDRKGKFVTARRYLRRRPTFAGNAFLLNK